jgi:hypothetical protein
MVIYLVLVDIVNTIAKSLGRLPPAVIATTLHLMQHNNKTDQPFIFITSLVVFSVNA